MSFITTRALFYQFTESSITASFPPIHSHKPSTHSHIQTASVEVGSHRSYEVGRPTRLPRGLRPEDPIVALGGRIPNEGVCVLVSGA